MLGVLRYAWALLKGQGARALLRRAWRRDRYVVFMAPMNLAVDPANRMTFHETTPRDLADLCALAPHEFDRIQSLRSGGWLHLARVGQRVVGYRLTLRDVPGHSALARGIRLAAHQTYTDHIFVDPAHRAQGIGRRLSLWQNRALAMRGFTENIEAIAPNNVAAVRSALRRRSRPILFVEATRRLVWVRCTTSTVMPPDVQRILEEAANDPHRHQSS